jgi:hypothetical protein
MFENCSGALRCELIIQVNGSLYLCIIKEGARADYKGRKAQLLFHIQNAAKSETFKLHSDSH